jgi:hypothetical protein
MTSTSLGSASSLDPQSTLRSHTRPDTWMSATQKRRMWDKGTTIQTVGGLPLRIRSPRPSAVLRQSLGKLEARQWTNAPSKTDLAEDKLLFVLRRCPRSCTDKSLFPSGSVTETDSAYFIATLGSRSVGSSAALFLELAEPMIWTTSWY